MRGKQAAQAARRRAATVESQIDSLKAEIQSLKREAVEARVAHEGEIRTLHAEIGSRAEKMAAERLDAEIARRVDGEVAAKFAEVSADRARGVLSILQESVNLKSLVMDVRQADFMARIAKVLGVPEMSAQLEIALFGELATRHARRMTPKKSAALATRAATLPALAYENVAGNFGLPVHKMGSHRSGSDAE